jgi:aspartate/methionine/tyrosine aminotransferase
MPFFKPFALERYFAKHEFSARYLLSSSDCESMTTRELLALEDGAAERFLDQRLGYTETRGDPGLRAALAGTYESLGPESIIVHAGAEEAILDFCLACLSPGDRVVVNFPCYQSLSEIPRAVGCAVEPWPLREEGEGASRRWAFDVEGLSRLLGPKTRAVFLNAPHNPTGALPTREEFDAIVALCREAGALLFSDEVYRLLEHNPSRRLPAACDVYEDAVSLGVLSKNAGLAGLRIGWLATRRADVLDAIASVKDYGTICSSAPSEFLAGVAVRRLPELVARSRSLIDANLALVEAFLARKPGFVSWTRPEGGSIGLPRLGPASGFADSDELARRLVAESGVMLLPGSLYSYDPLSFRLGYGRANLPEALATLEAWLDGRTR